MTVWQGVCIDRDGYEPSKAVQDMFRVTVQNDPERTVLKVEGRLVQPFVRELKECWRNAAGGAKPMILDVCSVTFVAPEGRNLLTEIHRAGGTLVGSGPMMNSIVEEITGQPVSERN